MKLANTIEIHCWNEETEVIEEIKSLFQHSLESTLEENMTIFKGSSNPRIDDYLLDRHEKIKWFSLFLYKDSSSIFHAGHWGKEFYSPKASDDDIAFIKSVMPAETIYHQY
ncbi:hypothetical protein [Radiobacillus sp. PE A8.2]|uniref:hypothetical protein n=1 Tax=Radiobacillus sp. PE A8.2 TaxID=3380349 RepID=UPI00388EE308